MSEITATPLDRDSLEKLSADDRKILAGEVINAPRGRFKTPHERARALLLNEMGWYGCRQDGYWWDSEVGAPCPSCGVPLKAERLPDRGSVFAQVYARYRQAVRPGGAE